MGWCDDSGKHEGWIQPVFADGRVGSGTSSGEGVYLSPLSGEQGWTPDGWAGQIRPYSEVTHLRMTCECGGWTGAAVAVADIPDSHIDRDYCEPTEEGERRFLDAWRRHIAPDDALHRLEDLADQRRDMEFEIEEAVADARSAGASWSQVGATLGLTRQGAQQRYAR